MSRRSFFLSPVVTLYALVLPTFILSLVASKPIIGWWGIVGYYSSFLSGVTTMLLFLLVWYDAKWKREVVGLCVGLFLGVTLIFTLIKILPLAAGSPVYGQRWTDVLGSLRIESLLSLCNAVSLFIFPRRVLPTGEERKRIPLLQGAIDLLWRGSLTYLVAAIGYLCLGRLQEAFALMGSILGWTIGVLITGLFIAGSFHIRGWHKPAARRGLRPFFAYEKIYARMLAFFLFMLLLTNLISVFYIRLGFITVTAGFVSYSFTFLMTDIVGELYGVHRAREVLLAGFVANVWMALLSLGILMLPGYKEMDVRLSLIFALTPGMVLGSMVAYTVGQWLDIQLFHFLKRITKGRYLWLRNNLATMTSQWIDTIIFGWIAWFAWPSFGLQSSLVMHMTEDSWYRLVLNEGVLKMVLALFDTPLLYLALYFIGKALPSMQKKSLPQ